MNIDDYQRLLTPELYEKFRDAVAIGKWPDGKPLSEQQRAVCMQAMIAYEHKYVAEESRTGYVAPKETPCDHKPVETPLKWRS